MISWMLMGLGGLGFCLGSLVMFAGLSILPQWLFRERWLDKGEELGVAVFLVGSAILLIGILTLGN